MRRQLSPGKLRAAPAGVGAVGMFGEREVYTTVVAEGAEEQVWTAVLRYVETDVKVHAGDADLFIDSAFAVKDGDSGISFVEVNPLVLSVVAVMVSYRVLNE